ncbi:tRNA Delta(2)-isopentenylpyrophosphate transferase [Thecamonas trahens ATCC 50062]|uniref:tRNA dimethylallyltransferase n=1 Tax=Thecamonas trahens ATCC 50062 TaxID=461836 RepID=A0A0L0DTM0_THETB|nr:tRNA Delta(2)-isopentenylpyrophosphate transferase [Thecamonas trahens ATCC 50062]KNC55406.1 tRNA Delta(2)-isopentenylpyrophosphate transferase [Thecamonas trahens ATCC 50062]|eukprot:XP_013752945.1 tRNA Delta(2)-isopentenylpyrophosphate transferase [Thecamonas trahens ATCC 50062]
MRRIIVLTGATGSCKTAVATALARRLPQLSSPLPVELPRLVSLDAVQVFRGPHIGAASPSPEQLEEAPTALVACRGLDEGVSAGHLAAEATEACRRLLDAGLVPVVVGGSGLYMDWFIDGPQGSPLADPAVRARIEAEVAARPQWEHWLGKVAAASPLRAERLVRGDWVKMRRALEIVASGAAAIPEPPRTPLAERLDASVCVFNLHWPRLDHLRLVDARCEDMVAAGLLPEVLDLVVGNRVGSEWALDVPYAGPPLEPGHHVAAAIGYAQSLPFLANLVADANAGVAPKILAKALGSFVKDFQAKSRQLTRKQNRWFARDDFLWLPLAEQSPDAVAETIARLALSDLADSGGPAKMAAALEAQAADIAAGAAPWKNSPDDLAALRTYQVRPTTRDFPRRRSRSLSLAAHVAGAP